MQPYIIRNGGWVTTLLDITYLRKQYWINQWGRGISAKSYNDIPSIHYRGKIPISPAWYNKIFDHMVILWIRPLKKMHFRVLPLRKIQIRIQPSWKIQIWILPLRRIQIRIPPLSKVQIRILSLKKYRSGSNPIRK